MDQALGQKLPSPGYLARVGRVLREQGAAALVTRVRRRVARSLLGAGGVTFFRRELDARSEPRPLTGFSVRQLRASDRDALLYGSESRWETLLSRFQAGDVCFGALDPQGRAVHTRWVTLTRARIPELDMDFVPGSDAAYFYDGYTRPDARRHGIDGVVRAAIFESLRALGRRRVYSYVRDDNPEGLRAAARSQQAVGSVRYVRPCGSRPRLFGAGAAPLAALLEPTRAAHDARRVRAEDWRSWFEGWLEEPLAKRSIGFHELPDEAFQAMAQHIGGTLGLDASRDVVLDVGCDSALVSRHVAPRCAQLVGVDFIAGMLIDAQKRRGSAGAVPANLCFAAADGRSLPFPAQTFDKGYCSGVIHTLPTIEDGVALVHDLVRVSKPGARILVAAVPDASKRWRARREAWRVGGLRDRLQIVTAAVLPAPVKSLARRLVPSLPQAPLQYLEYDLVEVQRELERRGLRCTIFDYPQDFWSRDFRETRSNLMIEVPAVSVQAVARAVLAVIAGPFLQIATGSLA